MNYLLSPAFTELSLIATGSFLLMISVPLAWIARRLSHWIEWIIVIYAVMTFSIGIAFIFLIFHANDVFENRAYIAGLLLGAAVGYIIFIADHVERQKILITEEKRNQVGDRIVQLDTRQSRERSKFTANFLNSCALAFIGSGLVSSLSGIVINPSLVPEFSTLAGFVAVCLVVAVALHLTARKLV